MDISQIKQLIGNKSLGGTSDISEIKETHISWILLSDEYAFKIKRPVKFSFLDFSDLEKRKYFCNEELRLNRRLAPQMYLKVLPVTAGMLDRSDNDMDQGKDEIIDYAVQMKRMNNDLEMDNLLGKDRVNSGQIDKLAGKIAGFHKRTNIVRKEADPGVLQKAYADIEQVIPFLEEEVNKNQRSLINRCIGASEIFVKENNGLLKKRMTDGFIKDCHGDLNSSNIFLYDDPVIFDCIEFNEEFRQIDILNEVAFLCVDLDFFNKEDLSSFLYHKYLEYSGIDESMEAGKLFMYYKSYRANIRAKVSILSARESEEDKKRGNLLKEAGRYLRLMEENILPK